jgi:rhodanese-related sulfurtransferase
MNKLLRQYFFPILLLAVLVFTITPCASPAATQAPATWKEISVADAAARRDAGAFVLDVRQPEEWQQAHIPGATLIPLTELNQRLNEIPKDKEIVVYCRSGNRSQAAAQTLIDNGFSGVSSMAGGINQWGAAGYPVEAGQ